MHLHLGWLQGASCTPLFAHGSMYSPVHTVAQPRLPTSPGTTTQPTQEAALLHLPVNCQGLLFERAWY